MSTDHLCHICFDPIYPQQQKFASSCCPKVISHYACMRKWSLRKRTNICIICRKVITERLKPLPRTRAKGMRSCGACGQVGHYQTSKACPVRMQV